MLYQILELKDLLEFQFSKMNTFLQCSSQTKIENRKKKSALNMAQTLKKNEFQTVASHYNSNNLASFPDILHSVDIFDYLS